MRGDTGDVFLIVNLPTGPAQRDQIKGNIALIMTMHKPTGRTGPRGKRGAIAISCSRTPPEPNKPGKIVKDTKDRDHGPKYKKALPNA